MAGCDLHQSDFIIGTNG